MEKIGKEVEKEFGLGGLSSGLYMDFAEQVALRYAQQERERIKKAFFTYLFNNSIEEELKGRFANEQYEKIWEKIIKTLNQ